MSSELVQEPGSSAPQTFIRIHNNNKIFLLIFEIELFKDEVRPSSDIMKLYTNFLNRCGRWEGSWVFPTT